MKTSVTDPWSNGTVVSNNCDDNGNNDARFEDSFVNDIMDQSRLSDSEQYLARLYSRLKHVRGGTSKKDLMNSLSDAKEDCIARLITNGQRFETEEEALLAANPVIRHIAPHLQALTASELVHLLKADVLQSVTDQQYDNQDEKIKIETTLDVTPKFEQSETKESTINPEDDDDDDDGNKDVDVPIRSEENTNVELANVEQISQNQIIRSSNIYE